MAAVMLIDIWERMHGYERWIETEATIESCRTTRLQVRGRDASYSENILLWTDRAGQNHRAPFTAPADSPLYLLVQGVTIGIRYNPADPEQYYLRELFQTRARNALSTTVIVALFIVAFMLFLWFRVLAPAR